MYYLVTIMILCINYSICQRVDSPQRYSINELMLPNDTDLYGIHDFFTHFEESYLNKFVPHSVVVLKATTEDLWKVKPLFENHPSFIYTETTTGGLHPDRLSRSDFLVVFLRDLSEQTLKYDIKIFSRKIVFKVLLIFEGIVQSRDISSLFASMNEINIDDPIFVHVDGNVVKFYGRSIGKDCSTEVRLISVWELGDGVEKLEIIKEWITRFPDHEGCPVTLITTNSVPKMILMRTGGVWSIRGGRDGKLVLTVAEKLNSTLKIRKATSADFKRSVQEIIIQKVAVGNADIGMGRLRQVNNKNDEFIMYSKACDHECLTWVVPRVMKLSNNIVTVELTWQVWILVGLVFVIGCATCYYLQKLHFSEDDNKNKKGFFFVFLDVVAIHLGIPAIAVPAPIAEKFSLLAFLCYAMVLTTAYKTSLASILVAENASPAIVDVQGIIDANLEVTGSQYSWQALEQLADDNPTNMELLKRFKVDNDVTTIGRQLQNGRGNIAFLGHASVFYGLQQEIIESHVSLNYQVFQGCVLFFETVIVVKKPRLQRSIDVVTRRLAEAGILELWDKDQEYDLDVILDLQSNETVVPAENRGRDKFKSVFLLYFFCTAVSILSFVIELIVYAKSNP